MESREKAKEELEAEINFLEIKISELILAQDTLKLELKKIIHKEYLYSLNN